MAWPGEVPQQKHLRLVAERFARPATGTVGFSFFHEPSEVTRGSKDTKLDRSSWFWGFLTWDSTGKLKHRMVAGSGLVSSWPGRFLGRKISCVWGSAPNYLKCSAIITCLHDPTCILWVLCQRPVLFCSNRPTEAFVGLQMFVAYDLRFAAA